MNKLAINRLTKTKFPVNKSFLILKRSDEIDYELLAEFATNHCHVVLCDGLDHSAKFISITPNLDKTNVPHFKSSL